MLHRRLVCQLFSTDRSNFVGSLNTGQLSSDLALITYNFVVLTAPGIGATHRPVFSALSDPSRLKCSHRPHLMIRP